MSSIDAGYDFISSYSEKEVLDLYKDRVFHAKKYLKESKLEVALGMIEDAAYYSDVLDERKVNHKRINYVRMKEWMCDMLYKEMDEHEQKHR